MSEKVIMIGTPVPATLHARMSAYLFSTKARADGPKTLKELAVKCILQGLDVLEVQETIARLKSNTPAPPQEGSGAYALMSLLRTRGARGHGVTLTGRSGQ